MKLFILLFATGLLVPIQAHASSATNGSVPEPVSLMLLGAGLAGLGVAELIRRRREK
jgi:MYXO-CTERM domain-containing protein